MYTYTRARVHHNHAQTLPGISATAIAVGFDHTCAIVTGGGVKCWGRNDFGQLGIGSTTRQNSPVDVSLGPGGRVRALARM
jgi:alpha-tubulin suppressor-like RCC1 family protein